MNQRIAKLVLCSFTCPSDEFISLESGYSSSFKSFFNSNYSLLDQESCQIHQSIEMAPRGKKAAAKATKAVEPEEAPVEAPSEPIVLHVTGLQRPWQDSELKEKLSSAAGKEILEYRVNDIRSEAFVTVRIHHWFLLQFRALCSL